MGELRMAQQGWLYLSDIMVSRKLFIAIYLVILVPGIQRFLYLVLNSKHFMILSGATIRAVQEYIYLNQTIHLGQHNFDWKQNSSSLCGVQYHNHLKTQRI